MSLDKREVFLKLVEPLAPESFRTKDEGIESREFAGKHFFYTMMLQLPYDVGRQDQS